MTIDDHQDARAILFPKVHVEEIRQREALLVVIIPAQFIQKPATTASNFGAQDWKHGWTIHIFTNKMLMVITKEAIFVRLSLEDDDVTVYDTTCFFPQ